MLALLDSVPTQGTAALSQDGLYQLSLGFYLVYVEKINRLKQAYQNKNMKLYSLYLQAYAEKNKGTQIAFDANRTLRYSTGKVKAAVPSEGVIYTPFTTVDGMLSRHRLYAGNKDFNLPALFRTKEMARVELLLNHLSTQSYEILEVNLQVLEHVS